MTPLRPSRFALRSSLLVGIISVVAAATIWYSMWTGVRVAEFYAPLIDAAMKVKLEATLAHLWFEEIISGDRHEDVAVVWQDLDQATWYAHAMLEGGRSSKGFIQPVKGPALRSDIGEVVERIAQLRAIAKTRLAAGGKAGIGSNIDQHFDAVFKDFLEATDGIEADLQLEMAASLKRFRLVQGGLIGSCFGLALLAGVILRRRELDRQEQSQSLLESEERYRIIADETPVMLCRFLPDGEITFANRANCDFFGKTSEELVGRSILSLIPEEDHEIVMAEIRSLTPDSPTRSHEHRVTGPGGEIAWNRWTNRALFDGDGRVRSCVSFGEDVTERKKAEEALQVSNRALAVLSECNQAVVRATEEGDLLQSICRILVEKGGYRLAWVGFAERSEGKSVRPTAQVGFEAGYLDTLDISWADTERGRGPTGTAVRTGRPVAARHIHTDPEFAPWREAALERGYSSSIALPLIAGERVFGALNVYSHEPDAFDKEEERLLLELAEDVANGVMNLRAKEEHRRAEEELRESEEKFRTLTVSSPVGMFLDDAQGNAIFINEKCAELVGMPAEEVYLDWAKAIHPDDRERVTTQWAKSVKNSEDFHLEFRWAHADGRVVWTVGDIVPVKGGDGEVTVFIGTLTDITERKRMEEKIRELNEALEARVAERTSELEQRVGEVERLNRGMLNLADDLQVANADLEVTARQLENANKELEAFAYSVSHDLRAPLRHIAGFVDILGENSADTLDETGQRHLRLIAESAGRMGTLIDDLLEFSRAGRMELHVGPLDLGRLTGEVMQEVQVRTEDREIVWEVGALPEVMADRATIRQVLANLLENAVKYTRPREPARIEIGTTPDDGEEVVVFVRDNGVGFDPQYTHKLFGVFQRLHRADEFEGSGIGLANVRRIISRHGGHTWAEGEVGEGATFFFSLPRKEEGTK